MRGSLGSFVELESLEDLGSLEGLLNAERLPNAEVLPGMNGSLSSTGADGNSTADLGAVDNDASP